MSQETSLWLNTMTLIGFTDQRGNAWHYQKALQGNEPNHYPGAIPLEDVQRRLFAWEAVSLPLYIPDGIGGFTEVPDRQAIAASDDLTVLGIFKDGYVAHQYPEWLLNNVATILDDDLGIGSAGLLRNRGQAWVSVEVPESVQTPEGVTFRPNLLACTSFDGTLATTYKRTFTNVVCDNTLRAGLDENGGMYRLKHTRYSGMKIADARDALEIVYTMTDDIVAEIERLTSWEVSPATFSKHLDILVPLTDKQGQPLEGRSLTMADTKRGEITKLYRYDPSAAPWNGTAWGVLQAHNTWAHHKQTVRGSSRTQRNREAALTGSITAQDDVVLKVLAELQAA